MSTLRWTALTVMTVKTPNTVPPRSDDDKQGNAKTQALLHSLFYDVKQPSTYTDKDNVYRAAHRVLSSITRRDFDDWFEEQLIYTLYRPVRLRFASNKTIVMSIDDKWQADLCDIQSL